MNQEYALARWREDAAKGDPKPYTVREWRGLTLMWLTVGGNTGWHHVSLDASGTLTEVATLALGMDVLNLVSPQQRRKIESVLYSPWGICLTVRHG